ncbi:MAG: T9SS type A sorting domain-containing protein [Bacteroidia bacterium]|jgi:hypothetical protein
MKKSFTLLMLSMGFMASAQNVVFVDAALGNDTLNGFSATVNASTGAGPKKSISAGLSLIAAGDILSVQSGVYNESVTFDQSFQLLKTGTGSVIMDEATLTANGDIIGNAPLDLAFQAATVSVQNGAQAADGYLLTANGGALILQSGAYAELLEVKKNLALFTIGNVQLDAIRMNANGGTLTLGGNVLLSSSLQLNQPNGGYVELSAYNLVISPGATLIGGNASSFVKTSGTGSLVQSFQNESMYFPVGSGSTFAPLTISDNGTPTDMVKARVREALNTNSFNPDLPAGVNSFVGLEWVLEESVPGSNNATIRFDYTGANELNNWVAAQNRAAYRNDGNTWFAATNSSINESYSTGLFNSLGGVFAIYSDFPNSVSSIDAEATLVYPNPTSNQITISGNSNLPTFYSIFSVDGRNVASGALQYNAPISVEELNAGLYFIQVGSSEATMRTLRFLKN